MRKYLITMTSVLLMLSLSGQTTFERTYDIYTSAFSDLVFSQNDGYLMAMISQQDNYTFYLSLVKTDLKGDTLWTKNYETGLNYLNDLYGTEDEQGNIYLSYNDNGIANQDLFKLDKNGNIIWSKNFHTIKSEMIVKDNVLWICGNTTIDGNYLYKIDAISGDSLWRSDPFNIDTTGFASSHCTSIAITGNNEVVITVSYNESWEPYLLESQFYKLLPNSTELVKFTLNTSDQFVVLDTKNIENELISVANYVGFNYNKCYFIRYNTEGTVTAFKEEEFGYDNAVFYKCVVTDDNKVVAMGGAVSGQSSYVMLHAFSMNGDSLWTQLHGNYLQTGWDLKCTSDNGFIVTGGEESNMTISYKPILLKTNSLGVLTSISEKTKLFQANVYPNPAIDNLIFETPGIYSGSLTILNQVGQIQSEITLTGQKTKWNCANLKSGCYIYKITSDKGITGGKIVIE